MVKQSTTKQPRKRTTRVKLNNPFFEDAYKQLEKSVRSAKKMSKEEALAWIKRVVHTA